MGCCGAKEDDQGVSFVAGQMDDGAVASVATIMPTPEQPLAKRAEGLAALPEHPCATVSAMLLSVSAILLAAEQHITKRAALLERLAALPEHLRLGVTLPGMRELLSQLPSDAAVSYTHLTLPTSAIV